MTLGWSVVRCSFENSYSWLLQRCISLSRSVIFRSHPKMTLGWSVVRSSFENSYSQLLQRCTSLSRSVIFRSHPKMTLGWSVVRSSFENSYSQLLQRCTSLSRSVIFRSLLLLMCLCVTFSISFPFFRRLINVFPWWFFCKMNDVTECICSFFLCSNERII